MSSARRFHTSITGLDHHGSPFTAYTFQVLKEILHGVFGPHDLPALPDDTRRLLVFPSLVHNYE
jgi:hypothetical protein